MLILENTSLIFEESSIFNKMNLVIKDNRKVAVTGVSGSGKSSFLHLLLGFYQANEGNISFDGEVLDSRTISEIRNNIAWLPQETNILCSSVRDLLMYIFQFKNNKKNTPDEESINAMLISLELDKKILDKAVSEISGGQKQRILLASVLLLNKKYLLLDEPTSALDDAISKKIFDRLLNLKQTTVIIASHSAYWMEKAGLVVECPSAPLRVRIR